MDKGLGWKLVLLVVRWDSVSLLLLLVEVTLHSSMALQERSQVNFCVGLLLVKTEFSVGERKLIMM